MVLKARDPVIGRLVALKTITSGIADIPDLLQRFYREARAAGSLQHPNIVTVYEMREEAGTPFIAMEYLEGESLEEIISRRAQLSLAQKLGYLVQVCRALDYAHRRGVVHRDIKPGNIVVTTEGTVKVVDFGIARLGDTSKTQTGMLLGTLAYMSPQQLHGKRADERSDIWSAGVMFYELISYQKPFSSENHGALILSIVNDDPRPLTEVAPECPPKVQALVHRALSKDEAKRFQTMEEFLLGVEPLWRRLQQAAVVSLVARGQELIGGGQLLVARILLRQALLVDKTNLRAKELLEEVNATLQWSAILPVLQEHVAKGKDLLDAGLLLEAKAEAEAALKLDFDFEPGLQLQREVELEIRRAREGEEERWVFVGSSASSSGALGEPAREYVYEGASSPGATPGPPEEFLRSPAPRRSGLPAGQTTPVLPEGRTAKPKAGRGAQGELASDALHLQGARPRGSGTAALLAAWRPRWKRRLGLASAGLAIALGAGAAIYRTMRATSPVPSAAFAPTSVEEQQRSLIAQAHEAADRNDYKTAQARLDDAEKLHGSLQPLIQDLRRRFTLEEQNPALQQIAEKERNLWLEAMNQMSRNHFDQAESAFRAILALPEGGRRKADAQHYLNEVVPKRKEEEQVFLQARRVQQKGDPQSLRKALQLLGQVIAYGGPRRPEAEQLQATIREKLRQPERQIALLAGAAREDVNRGDYFSARQKVSEIRQQGGDSSEISNEINRAEQAKLAQLESEYLQAKQRADDTTQQQLRDLQSGFRAIAEGGGPVADTARNYAENLIPSALKEAQAKVASRNVNIADTGRFNEAVDHYKEALAARDSQALKARVLPEFQRIAQGGGPEAAEAGRYVAVLIPAAIRDTTPWPVIACPAVPRGMGPTIKVGDLVACGLLDPPKIHWTQFSWPDFPEAARRAGQQKGITMLSVIVDQNGNVIEVKPRGPTDSHGFTDAASSAARRWKTNPPAAQGKPVRTAFSIDIPFNQ